MRKQCLVALLAVAFLIVMPAFAQSNDRSAEFNIHFGKSGASVESISMPRSFSGGGGFEAYVTQKFSMGFSGFYSRSGSLEASGASLNVSRFAVFQDLTFYPFEGRLRPYGTMGQGYGSNTLSLRQGDSSEKVNRQFYGFSLGAGIKYDLPKTKKYAIGVLARMTWGGGVRTTDYLAVVTWRLGD